jgi:hypothetical protein
MNKPKQWDDDATFGSDIIGVGTGWGNVTGKVKTAQIGFVREKRKPVQRKVTTNKRTK